LQIFRAFLSETFFPKVLRSVKGRGQSSTGVTINVTLVFWALQGGGGVCVWGGGCQADIDVRVLHILSVFFALELKNEQNITFRCVVELRVQAKWVY
jgi:hypothetical protein